MKTTIILRYILYVLTYEHDQKLEIFEFQLMNKQLIVDNAQMIPCVEGAEKIPMKKTI